MTDGKTNTHDLVRTSEKGTVFVGRCVNCGLENLRPQDSTKPCSAPQRRSFAEFVIGVPKERDRR